MIETTETKTCNRCGESYREGWLGHQCRDQARSEPSIMYRCPNCYGLAQHDEHCPSNPARYEDDRDEERGGR